MKQLLPFLLLLSAFYSSAQQPDSTKKLFSQPFYCCSNIPVDTNYFYCTYSLCSHAVYRKWDNKCVHRYTSGCGETCKIWACAYDSITGLKNFELTCSGLTPSCGNDYSFAMYDSFGFLYTVSKGDAQMAKDQWYRVFFVPASLKKN